MRDALTVYIDFARLIVERDRRFYQLMMRGQHMARLIEIKGLAGVVQDAKDAIRGARGSISGLRESATALALEAADIKQQIEEARADIKFEATTLGNSDGSDQQSEPRTKPIVDGKPFVDIATGLVKPQPIEPAPVAQVIPRPGA